MIRVRDVAIWTEMSIHEASLLKTLEDRDNVIKAILLSRDRDWLNSLEH